MQTMRRIDVQINGKLVGSCDSISEVSSPLFKDIIDSWIEIEGFVPASPSLTDDQQFVLEWLKEQVSIGNDLQYVLWEFTDNVYEEPAEYSVSEQTKAWLELTEQEQFQILAAFAEWGRKLEVAE